MLLSVVAVDDVVDDFLRRPQTEIIICPCLLPRSLIATDGVPPAAPCRCRLRNAAGEYRYVYRSGGGVMASR